MLRDIQRETEQVLFVAETIRQTGPDILILQGFDYDARNTALNAFRDLLDQAGVALPHAYAPQSNTGIPTGFDIDGDGQKNAPRDAQGYGRFPGQAGLAVLSRYPIAKDAIRSFSDTLWRNANPSGELSKLIPEQAIPLQRLSSVAHAAIPIDISGGRLWVLTHHATPPVFDGPEDRNGYRNADENRFWLDKLASGFPEEPFVLAGQMNLDPSRGEGHHQVLLDILNAPYVTDPFANWPAEYNHTVIYPPPGPGKLRVSYLLPSSELRTFDAGMSPTPAAQMGTSRHRILWVDVEFGR